MPATLCSERGWERYPIRPVFFAPTDIQPNDLNEELKSRLRDSKNLIVICSPNSAKSKWVAAEIEYFYSLGRAKDIHFFIVEGSPNSENPNNECFNPVIKSLGLDGVLGANINEANYGQSKADFISKMNIALKEAVETNYWLRLLQASDYLSEAEFSFCR